MLFICLVIASNGVVDILYYLYDITPYIANN